MKVEFFTPTRQIPHCGHATVATFSLCNQLGLLRNGDHLKESIDGILALTVTSAGDVTMHQAFPAFVSLKLDSHIGQRAMRAIGAASSSIISEQQLVIARSGNAFLPMPLVSERALAALKPNQYAIAQVCEELDLVGFTHSL